MKAIRCSNGHWYDSETYDKCPHCGQTNTATQAHSDNAVKENKKGFSLFKKSKKGKTSATPVVTEDKVASVSTAKGPSSATHDDVTERFFADIDDDKTMSMFEPGDTTGVDSGFGTEELPAVGINVALKKTASEPLAAAVQRVSAMDEGKTLGYFNAMTNQNESTGTTSANKASEPVVGWLVAICGLHFGESFQLYVGKNTIGRSNGNKVVLGLDQSVSRENHATIIYEPKKREFYLQSGNSDGLIYLNDSFVNGTQIIKENDTLEIGSSKLIFIPLCGTDFSWEQYM